MELSKEMFETLKENFSKYRMAINPSLLRVSLPEGDKSYKEALVYHEAAMMSIAHFAKKRLDLVETAVADLRQQVAEQNKQMMQDGAGSAQAGHGGFFSSFQKQQRDDVRRDDVRAAPRIRRLSDYEEAAPLETPGANTRTVRMNDESSEPSSDKLISEIERKMYKTMQKLPAKKVGWN